MWRARSNDILVVDRSMHSAYYVYLHLFGELDNKRSTFATLMHNELDEKQDAFFVYMDTQAIVCYDRIIKRNRADEATTITLQYIEQQHALFDIMLQKLASYHPELTIYKYDHTTDDANEQLQQAINKYFARAN